MQLYIDMDGVLADFDRHHEAMFGTRPCKIADNVDWKVVRKVKDFYLNIPPVADLEELWARKHLGAHVPVICCPAREKYLHAGSGNVLIDDWEKYKDLWVAAGGRWVTHKSAADTARQLSEIGL